METLLPLLGSWASHSEDHNPFVESCVWHVVDHQTCAYEHHLDTGLLVSWFQYWVVEGGILQFPLSETTRWMFTTAVCVSITLESGYLLMNGHRLNRVHGLSIPERFDLFPGTRPDENGQHRPYTFKRKLQGHLTDPPKGELGEGGKASPATS